MLYVLRHEVPDIERRLRCAEFIRFVSGKRVLFPVKHVRHGEGRNKYGILYDLEEHGGRHTLQFIGGIGGIEGNGDICNYCCPLNMIDLPEPIVFPTSSDELCLSKLSHAYA